MNLFEIEFCCLRTDVVDTVVFINERVLLESLLAPYTKFELIQMLLTISQYDRVTISTLPPTRGSEGIPHGHR